MWAAASNAVKSLMGWVKSLTSKYTGVYAGAVDYGTEANVSSWFAATVAGETKLASNTYAYVFDGTTLDARPAGTGAWILESFDSATFSAVASLLPSSTTSHSMESTPETLLGRSASVAANVASSL